MITPRPTFDAAAPPAVRLAAVARLAKHLRSSTRPILLGPWRSELGFEGLYWLPFLTRLAEQVPGFATRAHVVTRGGLAPLYGAMAAGGYDLYALRSVAEVRRENLYDYSKSKMQKQLAPTDWDDGVLEQAAERMGLPPVYEVVHPAWAYWALAPFWDDHVSLRHVDALCRFTPLPRLPKPAWCPERYVAVKFYGRATFPYPEAAVATFVTKTLQILAAQSPVVVLASGSAYDDHLDAAVVGPNLVLPPSMTPETNLMMQAAAVQHATAFVGTYGGVAQLALRLGVPSVSFWKDFGGTAHAHLALSSWLSKTAKVPFVAGSLDDAWLLQQTVSLPVMAVAAPPPVVAGVT